MNMLEQLLNGPINIAAVAVVAVALALGLAIAIFNSRLLLLGGKNLFRNSVRTMLTFVATGVLVFMITLIWTVVTFLDDITQERARDLKIVITERWQRPSQLPLTHADYLNPQKTSQFLFKDEETGIGVKDFMTWSFYGGTLDPSKRTRENLVFFFVMEPDQIIPMMDDLENYDPKLVEKMRQTRNGCLVGPERLAMMNKRVGERFKVTGLNYKDVDLEFEIVGELPAGRYSMNAIMNAEYFNQELDRYAREKGAKHPLDGKRLNLIWLRVPDRQTFNRVAAKIESASVFADRPVKCETASSGVAAFIEPYQDLIWGMKWLLVPAIFSCVALVVANAISISVRERRTEMAVMKVLGYRPLQILGLVLGEALLVGGLSGLVASALAYGIYNGLYGGLPFNIAFYSVLPVPFAAFVWGPAIGFLTAFLGSVFPAWSASSVKVSEVFAKVA